MNCKTTLLAFFFGVLGFISFGQSTQINCPDLYKSSNPYFNKDLDSYTIYLQQSSGFSQYMGLNRNNFRKFYYTAQATGIFQKGKLSFSFGYTVNRFTNKVFYRYFNGLYYWGGLTYRNLIIFPDLVGQMISFENIYFFNEEKNGLGKIGMYINLGMSPSKWLIEDPQRNTLITYKTNPTMFKGMVFYQLIQDEKICDNGKLDLIIRGGITKKFLTGKLARNNELLLQTFGENRSSFWGIEINSLAIINRTTLFFSASGILEKENKNILSNCVYSIGIIWTKNHEIFIRNKGHTAIFSSMGRI